ncbi:hypothetical protein L3X38_026926 [Prunus dulcis]|uniref:Uncharacterized protein n=1 Tax=Prunus dulcis TaxID=3755 RepID=A0AAD4VLY8_PRUDU|nr:hypothetical protein L3X38_026926 [Prunus dulcis]
MTARRLFRIGCSGYLAHVIDTRDNGLRLEDIPGVMEFPDVFPEELPGLPHHREIGFTSELLLELVDKGFIRPSFSSWGTPVLLLRGAKVFSEIDLGLGYHQDWIRRLESLTANKCRERIRRIVKQSPRYSRNANPRARDIVVVQSWVIRPSDRGQTLGTCVLGILEPLGTSACESCSLACEDR